MHNFKRQQRHRNENGGKMTNVVKHFIYICFFVIINMFSSPHHHHHHHYYRVRFLCSLCFFLSITNLLYKAFNIACSRLYICQLY